jgi:hypothetical protein
MPIYYIWDNGSVSEPLDANKCINTLLHTNYPVNHTVDVEERLDGETTNAWNFQTGNY